MQHGDRAGRRRSASTAGLAVSLAAVAALAAVTGANRGGPAVEAVMDERPVAGDSVDRRVVLTFDDLPMTPGGAADPCEREAVRSANRRLLATLEATAIPAAGLVTAGNACGPDADALLRDVLEAWLDAGHALGNHTHSHPDVNDTPLARYAADIERGGEPVERLLRERGRELRYFRHPFLHAGDTPAKKDSLAALLDARGYTVAPVTIDNQEWVFAAVYARAKERGDTHMMRRVVDGYLEHMAENFAYYERLSRRLLGREIPQVLLLHVNEINADHLGGLVAMMRGRGYRFIGLDEALADPAYALPDEYVGARGLSWLQRWALTRGVEPEPEPREPEWVARLYREY